MKVKESFGIKVLEGLEFYVKSFDFILWVAESYFIIGEI